MAGPRPLPAPAEPCVIGAVLFAGSMVVAAVAAFLIGVTVAKRIWPEVEQ